MAALVSTLTRRPARERLAMTGEITLSGEVLPVGGIKEKTLAAKRAGVREIIMPADNEPNVHEDLNQEMLEGLQIHFVKTIHEAIDLALQKEPVPVEAARPTRDLALARPSAANAN